MDAAGRKAWLDNLLLSSLSRLEATEETCALTIDGLEEESGRTVVDFANWEKKNAPYVLPADVKAFYSAFNGLGVGYQVGIGGKLVSVGEMRLNKLEAIGRVALEGTFPKMNWPKVDKAVCQGGRSDSFVLDLKTSAAFTIDSSLEIGDVVLLYRVPDIHDEAGGGGNRWKGLSSSPYEDPEIWFQDISARWHFVCSSFTNFMRLMVAHLGVYGWHLAYTQEGLPTETIHWMGLFCRERVCVDVSHNAR